MFTAITISIAVLFGAIIPSPVQSQVIQPERALVELVAEALQNNPEIANWQAIVDAAGERVSQAGTLPDPTFSFSLMNLPTNSFNFRQEPMTAVWINAGQVLPLTGRIGQRTDIVKSNLESTINKKKHHELMIVEEIVKTWFDWTYLHAADRTIDKNISVLEDLIVVITRKYETGKGLQQDILRAETERTRLIEKRTGLRQEIITTGRRLAILAGRDPGDIPSPPTELQESFPTIKPDALTERMFINNPEWNSLKAESRASQKNVALARSLWVPDVKLGVGYGIRHDSNNGIKRADLFSLTAGITIPIHGKKKQGSAIQEAKALNRAAISRQLSLELELRFRLDKLIDEDRRLDEQIILYEQGIEPQTEATLVAATASYMVGKADFEALLTSETAIFTVQLERLARIRDRQKVRASIAVLTGGDDLISMAENINREKS